MGDLEGFLHISSGGVEGTGDGEVKKGWLRRSTAHEQPPLFFRLQDNVLSYAKNESDIAMDIILMQNTVSATPDGTNEVIIKFKDANRKPLVLRMDSPAERNKWLAVLQSKTSSATTAQNRKVSRRITVDFDDSKKAPAKPRKKMISLDIEDDEPKPAEKKLDSSTIVLETPVEVSDVTYEEDDDEDDDDNVGDEDVMQSCIDFASKIKAQQKEEPPKQTNPFLDDDIRPNVLPKKSTNPFDDDDDVAPPSNLPALNGAQNQSKTDEVVAHVDLDDHPAAPASTTVSSSNALDDKVVIPPVSGKKEEDEKPLTATEEIMPDSVDDSMIPEDSFISADGRPFSADESFIIPDGPGEDRKEDKARDEDEEDGDMCERSTLCSTVCETQYTQSVLMPKPSDDKSLVRQFRMWQEKSRQGNGGSQENSEQKKDQQAVAADTTEKKPEEPSEKEAAKSIKEKEPEWTLTKDSYVQVKDPTELRLLLKWGVPKRAAGIFADGIMIDFNPDEPPYWKLNDQGRIRIAMTKQEKLERIRARIVQAEKEGDRATVEALMQRHKDVANTDESDMTCFHFLDDLKLCFRDGEWVIMKQLPPPEADPNEWINVLSARLSKFFTTAGKALWNLLDFNEQAQSTASASAIEKKEPAPDVPAQSASEINSSEAEAQKKSPKDLLFENLQKDIGNLLRIVSAGQTDEEMANLANDEKNPRVARLVRTFLCTDIAEFASHGFKKERLFGVYHIWDWILSYGNKRVVAATSIDLLAMQKAIATVDALQYDKNASFRAFICLALSSKMLETWFALIVSDSEKMDKFFRPEAYLRDEKVITDVRAQLIRLSKIPFSLSVDFEARGMMAQKQ